MSGRATTIIITILVIVVIAMIIAVYLYQQSNNRANQNNILYPFSGSIQPGDNTVTLLNAAGTPQIDCSAVGGKINIVGAWTEVIDPYGECTGSSAGMLNLSCGLTGPKISCNQDSDCGPGMSCAGGVCKPSVCPLTPSEGPGMFNSANCSCGGTYCPIQPGTPCGSGTAHPDCNDPNGTLMTCVNGICEVNAGQSCTAPDPFVGQFCAIYPLCANAGNKSQGNRATDFINAVCDPNDTDNKCRPRDSSAYLASKCDGQTTCNVTFDPTNPLSGFGPAPCSSNVAVGSTNYDNLPIIPGQGGSYNQGYYVHGLYTCVL